MQNFGRAYLLLPGPFAADFVEEPDQGYEPSEMLGVEKLHVFKSEKYGWQQLTVAGVHGRSHLPSPQLSV